MPFPPELLSLHVSPWSERARWSLDHHAIAYSVLPHVPILGERRLRRLVGPTKPRATVPVLIDGDLLLTESWDIARYADRVGRETLLIPAEHEAAIAKWSRIADDAMQSGRALIIAAMIASPAALDENIPPGVPRWLRPLLRPVGRRTMQAFARKYALDFTRSEDHSRTLAVALGRLRQALGSRSFLLGSFTYADIVMATLLQGVSPVSDRHLRLGPATREAWTRHALATEYADLLAWRDRLYAIHRRPPNPSTSPTVAER